MVDVRCVVFQAEFGKRAEFLAVKLDGAAGEVARAAGVQVDADPLAQIGGLVDFQIGGLGEKEVRFHSVGARISEWKEGRVFRVGIVSVFLQGDHVNDICKLENL